MAQFYSWLTADTKESIGNIHSKNPHTKQGAIYLLQPEGVPIKEESYEGLGQFGHIHAATWLMIMNRPDWVVSAIHHLTGGECGHTYMEQLKKGWSALDSSKLEALNFQASMAVVMLEDPEYPLKLSYNEYADYNALPASEVCPYQGHYYDRPVLDTSKLQSDREHSSEELLSIREDFQNFMFNALTGKQEDPNKDNNSKQESKMSDYDEDNQKAEWELLMEEDSTLEAHVARYETGETTTDDYYRLAADTLINGNFDSAVDFVMEAITDESESPKAVATVKEHGMGAISDGQFETFIERLNERMDNFSIGPR
jgi:hypothetical protein